MADERFATQEECRQHLTARNGVGACYPNPGPGGGYIYIANPHLPPPRRSLGEVYFKGVEIALKNLTASGPAGDQMRSFALPWMAGAAGAGYMVAGPRGAVLGLFLVSLGGVFIAGTQGPIGDD